MIEMIREEDIEAIMSFRLSGSPFCIKIEQSRLLAIIDPDFRYLGSIVGIGMEDMLGSAPRSDKKPVRSEPHP